mgnify:CR=1 FL=1
MRILVAAVAVVFALPAAAQEKPFQPVVEALVREVLVPAYDAFAATAAEQAALTAALCEAPSQAALDAARGGFGALIGAFAGIEPYRFGPAARENRYERLFFWPDRRGRGLRQVQGIIGGEDDTAVGVESLANKSVAVQGLPALEFVLFGTGSDELATIGGFRCDYGATIAGAIAAVGEVMAAEWNAEFAGTMLNSGPDNDAYRSDAEALQDILQAAATQMELTGTQKLAAVVRYSPEAARPKRAAFWRSGQTLPMVSANVATVRSILEGGVGDLLEDDVSLRGALFELSQIDRALTPLLEDGRPFVELAVDPDAHRRLAFAVSPAAAAQALIAERIQGALGLVAGFNALDGD